MRWAVAVVLLYACLLVAADADAETLRTLVNQRVGGERGLKKRFNKWRKKGSLKQISNDVKEWWQSQLPSESTNPPTSSPTMWIQPEMKKYYDTNQGCRDDPKYLIREYPSIGRSDLEERCYLDPKCKVAVLYLIFGPNGSVQRGGKMYSYCYRIPSQETYILMIKHDSETRNGDKGLCTHFSKHCLWSQHKTCQMPGACNPTTGLCNPNQNINENKECDTATDNTKNAICVEGVCRDPFNAPDPCVERYCSKPGICSFRNTTNECIVPVGKGQVEPGTCHYGTCNQCVEWYCSKPGKCSFRNTKEKKCTIPGKKGQGTCRNGSCTL